MSRTHWLMEDMPHRCPEAHGPHLERNRVIVSCQIIDCPHLRDDEVRTDIWPHCVTYRCGLSNVWLGFRAQRRCCPVHLQTLVRAISERAVPTADREVREEVRT